MLPQYFLFLLIPLSIFSAWTCFISISTKQIRPNLSSNSIWLLANLVALIGGLQKGATLFESFNIFLVVCVLSVIIGACLYYKQFYSTKNKIDIICFALGVIGIFCLLFVPEKNFAIAIAILVDFVATLPTLFKIWFSKKDTDSWQGFGSPFVMVAINLATISNYTFANCGFLIYVLVSTFNLSISTLIKNHKLKKPQPSKI
jgi:hypothetical protein